MIYRVPLFLALLLLVSGCASPPQTVRLVTFAGAEAPLLAAKLGLFTQAGIAVELDETPGISKAMEALLAGSADSIIGTFEQVIQLQAKGQDIVAYSLLTECHCLALVSTKATKVQDLNGKMVGVGAPGGAMQTFVEFLLAKEALPKDAASFAAIGVGPTSLAAIEGGKVDAGVVLANTLVQLRARNPKLHVLAETFTPEGSARVFGQSRYPAMALIAKRSWLASHPDEARRIVKALQQSIAWIGSNGPEGVHRQLPSTQIDALRMHLPRYSAWAELQTNDVTTVANYLKIDIDPARTFVNDIVRQARSE